MTTGPDIGPRAADRQPEATRELLPHTGAEQERVAVETGGPVGARR
ncbi:hypothetical protein [Actinopolyspora alba]|nr:hypothetical protein [Actinopolyspora alba]